MSPTPDSRDLTLEAVTEIRASPGTTRIEPPRRIAWRVWESGMEWSYELEPTPDGTRLVERRVAPRGTKPLGRAFGRVFLGGLAQHDDELLARMRATPAG